MESCSLKSAGVSKSRENRACREGHGVIHVPSTYSVEEEEP